MTAELTAAPPKLTERDVRVLDVSGVNHDARLYVGGLVVTVTQHDLDRIADLLMRASAAIDADAAHVHAAMARGVQP